MIVLPCGGASVTPRKETAVSEAIGLKDLYPRIEDIPAEHHLAGQVHQDTVLVNGELRAWTGARQKVVSPIHVRDDDGALKAVELGSIPQGGIPEAEEALAAAVAAYDSGRGTWPTMKVADRIACMQEFTRQMVARRGEIVRLIMWEIAKSLPDSEKEFDRTVDYMRATMDALRTLDNASRSSMARSARSGARLWASFFAWAPTTIL
jgi:glyceraldehyde-3-phosphate dehydrogenase (NADP+)